MICYGPGYSLLPLSCFYNRVAIWVLLRTLADGLMHALTSRGQPPIYIYTKAEPSDVQWFCLWLRSQSMDRVVCTRGVCPCITPNARLWLRHRQRLMLSEEKFLLQSMPMKRHQRLLEDTPCSVLRTLAGNSWCYHNFACGFVCALATVPIRWFED